MEVAVFPASLCSPQTNDTLSACIFIVPVFLSLLGVLPFRFAHLIGGIIDRWTMTHSTKNQISLLFGTISFQKFHI